MLGTIFWPTLTGGIIIFVIMFWRIRDGIDPRKRDKIEHVLMALAFIVLLADVGMAIYDRADEGRLINDCIAFYRYFPDYYPQEDYSFYFLERCSEVMSAEDIQTLKQSGWAWDRKRMDAQLSEGGWDNVTIRVQP